MAKRDLIVRLEDIRTKILAIESILQEAGEESSMLKSEVYKLALERSFEIIGEALYQIQKQHEFQPVSDMSRIISLRHLLAHDYFKINHSLLWALATEKIPVLKKEILDWIDRENLRLFGTIHPEID
ncbi:MAG: DUF86 domain-containing protein [Bacteroidetes bacterium]|uniref:HepT-like ribonuclease domain-containing protein n=1 Tax=Phnomibacter sp. TaxID=2836217 RepID=UPI002FDD678E|nr:DUF86 domain-containing protein [Bacteroidota bacterium]